MNCCILLDFSVWIVLWCTDPRISIFCTIYSELCARFIHSIRFPYWELCHNWQVNMTVWLNIITFQELIYSPNYSLRWQLLTNLYIVQQLAYGCRRRSATVSDALLDVEVFQPYWAGIKLLRACIVEVSVSTPVRSISIHGMRVCFLGIAKINRV
jgi:hypothetical protein